MRNDFRRALGLGLCLLSLLAGAACGPDRDDDAPDSGAAAAAPATVRLSPSGVRAAGIRTAPVGEGALVGTLRLTGTLAAKPWTPEEQAALSAAASADAKARLAQANYRRLARLYGEGIAARQDLDAARAARDQTRADAEQADAARANLGLTAASEGLERQAPIWGLAVLSDVDLAKVRPGERAAVTTPAFPGVAFPGRVSGVSRSEDPDTRSFTVRIAIADAARRLRPQMLATFDVSVPAAPGLSVPRSAILLQGDGSYVYVADGDSFRKQRVALGAAAGDRVEVASGLSAGQTIVVAGAQLLESERLKAQLQPDED